MKTLFKINILLISLILPLTTSIGQSPGIPKLCFTDIEGRDVCKSAKEIIDPVRSHPDLRKFLKRIEFDKIFIASKITSIDPHLLISIAYRESNFNRRAVSSVGAVGVMQILPSTRKYLVEKFDDHDDHVIGAIYLNYMRSHYGFTWVEAVAAYNEGPTRVSTRKKDPNFGSNHQYLQRVLGTYMELKNYDRKKVSSL